MRVLFLGNDDNLNFRMAKWSREFGVEADLWVIQPPDPYRGDIKLLIPEGPLPGWVRDVPIGDFFAKARSPGAFGKFIDDNYDFIHVCGPASLIASRSLQRPVGFLCDGGEVGDLPFPFKKGYALSQGNRRITTRVKYAVYTRAALKRVRFIIDSYDAHTHLYKNLGLTNKVVYRGVACDIQADRALVNKPLLAELTAKYRSADRTFMWFSRLNFSDPKSVIYKGADRFLEALKTILPELRDGRVRLVVGKHGNELSEFLKLVEASGVSPYIDWVGHLSASELLTYLSLPNAVLFAEFGDHLRELTGIGRDAAVAGTVTVSSARPEYLERQYGNKSPLIHAITATDLAQRMREVIDMPDDKFQALRADMRRYGETSVDYHALMPRYYELVQRSLRA